MALTGRFEFRKAFRGKLVLQLEEEVQPFWRRAKPKRRWRDATLLDLAAPEMRFLVDRGLKRWSRFQTKATPDQVPESQQTAPLQFVEAGPAHVQPFGTEANRAA